MNLQVYELNIRRSDALRSHVERRFHFALARILRRVGLIVVRFADLNGPRGGRDKRCDVQVQLVGGQTVRIRETDECLYRATNRDYRRDASNSIYSYGHAYADRVANCRANGFAYQSTHRHAYGGTNQ